MTDYIWVFLSGFVSGILPAFVLLVVRVVTRSVRLIEES